MEAKSEIPTELDWGDYHCDEDAVYSHKTFFGKDLAEAELRFRKSVLEACDELRFMPALPFRYYIFAFRNYVMSTDLVGNSASADAACCFLDLIVEKLIDSPEMIRPVIGSLMPTVEYIANNQVLFDADPEIYGNFIARLQEIKRRA